MLSKVPAVLGYLASAYIQHGQPVGLLPAADSVGLACPVRELEGCIVCRPIQQKTVQ